MNTSKYDTVADVVAGHESVKLPVVWQFCSAQDYHGK